MKQLKQLATALTAVLALTGITATIAQAAEPNILPEATGASPIRATSSSGLSAFGNGILSIESAKSTSTVELNSLKLGFFDLQLEESKNALTGGKCTGLLDITSGVVLALGTFHIRDYKEGTNLRTAAVFLIRPVHFSCPGALIVIEGCVAGKLTPESTLTKTLIVTMAKTGGDNDIITVLNEANTAEEACQFLASENGSAFRLGAFTSTPAVGSFEKGTERGIALLVMPL
jgi:hypothetical protein